GGLVVANATVVIRYSIAAANASHGFFVTASTAGTTADLSADNCQASHSLFGFFAGNGSGTARLMVSNSVAVSNAVGIDVFSNGTVRASNNTVTRNNTGLVQSGSGVLESRGNNTVRGNLFTDTAGTITPFGPI